MKSIFCCIDDAEKLGITWDEVDRDLSTLGITDVFIHSGARDDRLKEAVNTFHLHGRKVHLCTDCFSGGKNDDANRWNEIINETTHAYNNYKIDGLCLDAVRFWQPKGLKNWIKFIFSNWNKRCDITVAFLIWIKFWLKEYRLLLTISACLKCETPSYKLSKLLAKMYGQEFKLMAQHIDLMLIMSYKYCYGFWDKLKWSYNPVNLATEMQADTGTPTTPLLQCYYNEKEHNSLGRMPTWKEIREDMFLDNWCLYLYGDMKQGGLF